MHSTDLQVTEEESTTESLMYTPQSNPDLATIIQLIKSKPPKTRFSQLPFLDNDSRNNIYLNSGNVISNKPQSPLASIQMSRYIRAFPSMLYGPFRITQTTIKPDFPSCWAIFSHLPPIAKQRGTAVESIAFHQVCNVNIPEK